MGPISKSMERRIFIQAEALIPDYQQPMLIVRANGWRVTEYDLNYCELAKELGHRVYHWVNGKWNE